MFTKYEKMSESAGDWNTRGVRSFKSRAADDHWVVTEKIHGANFSLVVDAAGVRCAKRDAVLDADDDTFYAGHRAILATHGAAAQQLLAHLQQHSDTPVDSITIFGELYGGRYPHPEVAAPPCGAVQQGVWYSPALEWTAYDLTTLAPDGTRAYVPFKRLVELLAAHNIPCAEPLLVAPFQECVNFKLPFQSRIAKKLGYPTLPDNQAEGVVIKPYASEVMVPTIAKGKMVRAILKIKAEKFSELSDKRVVKGLEGASDAHVLCKMCVNANRLAAVVSKTGKLTKKNRSEVTSRFIDDVVEEVERRGATGDEKALRREAAAQVEAFMATQK
eukprot:Rhum_TRINITY_DN11579_c0_g2::Rhum_TRINITY_DN11579_c0_g2_i1::g.45295::m.45295